MKKNNFGKLIVAVLVMVALCVPCTVHAEPGMYCSYLSGMEHVSLGKAKAEITLWQYSTYTSYGGSINASDLPFSLWIAMEDVVKGATYSAALTYYKKGGVSKPQMHTYKAKKNGDCVFYWSFSLKALRKRSNRPIIKLILSAKKGKKTQTKTVLCYWENGHIVAR